MLRRPYPGKASVVSRYHLPVFQMVLQSISAHKKLYWGKGFSWDPTSFAAARKAIGKDEGDFKTKDLTEIEKAKFYEIADINWGTSYYFGIKGGFEQQEFNYISNLTTYESEQVSKTSFSISASAGVMAEWGILTITFNHLNGYQGDDPVKYYIPVNSTGVQIEKELSPSAPQRQNSERLRIEFLSIRKPKVKGNEITRSPLRINPNFNFEFNQKLFSFEFPVYFLTSDNDKTNFNGGIYGGYISGKDWTFTTDKRNFGFGVFIGANFTKLFQ